MSADDITDSDRQCVHGLTYPWNATPLFDVSAMPPAAYPVPSRVRGIISLSASTLSQATHCLEGLTSESVHVLQVT